MSMFKKPNEQVIRDALVSINGHLANICKAFLNVTATEGATTNGSISSSTLTWSGSSEYGYRKLLVDAEKCISFDVKITLSDGSVWTHRAYNKSSYTMELGINQADIVQVEVTELNGATATNVAINLLTK